MVQKMYSNSGIDELSSSLNSFGNDLAKFLLIVDLIYTRYSVINYSYYSITMFSSREVKRTKNIPVLN